jgi:hypothetical protein
LTIRPSAWTTSSGFLESGRPRIARIDQSVEKINKALEVKDRDIAELRARIKKLEGGG